MTRSLLAALALLAVFAPVIFAQVAAPQPFGTTPDGAKVEEYTLKNKNGMIVKLMTLGATITEIGVPDKNGKIENVVLGFDKADDYLGPDNQYFGCTTGRVANRIALGKFQVDGKEYQLAINDGKHTLHGGGPRSLSRVVWKAAPAKNGQSIEFTYSSPDGEEGFPGKLDLSVTYELTDANALAIRYAATTDKATPVNLTNHAYFNLAGAGAKTAVDHELMIPSQKFAEADATLIPTGKFLPVAGTRYDFSKPKRIGQDIEPNTEPGPIGYDLAYELPKGKAGELVTAAVLRDPASGRTLTVTTDQPAIQFYTGNFLKGQKGRDGKTYANRSAVCLETFAFTNSMNTPGFPDIILRPGQTYRQVCVYGFSAK